MAVVKQNGRGKINDGNVHQNDLGGTNPKLTNCSTLRHDMTMICTNPFPEVDICTTSTLAGEGLQGRSPRYRGITNVLSWGWSWRWWWWWGWSWWWWTSSWWVLVMMFRWFSNSVWAQYFQSNVLNYSVTFWLVLPKGCWKWQKSLLKKGKAKQHYDVLTTTFTFFEATLNTFWEDQSHCMIRTFGLILQILMPGQSGLWSFYSLI